MKRRSYLVIKNDDGLYLSDIDQTHQPMWTDTLEDAGIFDIRNKKGEQMYNVACNIMLERSVKYYTKCVFLTIVE